MQKNDDDMDFEKMTEDELKSCYAEYFIREPYKTREEAIAILTAPSGPGGTCSVICPYCGRKTQPKLPGEVREYEGKSVRCIQCRQCNEWFPMN